MATHHPLNSSHAGVFGPHFKSASMQKFKPTPEMIAAAETVFMTMAFVQTIRPIVVQYQTSILALGNWKIAPQFAARLGSEVILDPKSAYLMTSADFALYDQKCKQARVVARLHVANEDQCPLLVAEELARQAEHALVEAMSESTNLSVDKLLSAGLDKYRQFIELTLKLLAPYVKNGLATSN